MQAAVAEKALHRTLLEPDRFQAIEVNGQRRLAATCRYDPTIGNKEHWAVYQVP